MLKKILPILLILSMASTAFSKEFLRIGGVSITGGGMSLVGTISTLSLEDKHEAFTYVGWTLIVVGLLIDGGDLVIGNANAAEFKGKEVWDAMVREASVLARSPELAKADTPIMNASNQVEIPIQELSTLVLNIDQQINLFKSKDLTIDKAAISKKLFPLGFVNETQERAFENMVAIASMR